MIDPSKETIFSLSEAPRECAKRGVLGRSGKPCHKSYFYRALRNGLEHFVACGRTYTSWEALLRYFSSRTEQRRGQCENRERPEALTAAVAANERLKRLVFHRSEARKKGREEVTK